MDVIDFSWHAQQPYIYINHIVDRDSRNSFEDIRAFENFSILLSAVLGVV
jgi:hypothetical protein